MLFVMSYQLVDTNVRAILVAWVILSVAAFVRSGKLIHVPIWSVESTLDAEYWDIMNQNATVPLISHKEIHMCNVSLCNSMEWWI